jgi:hypothetical protein
MACPFCDEGVSIFLKTPKGIAVPFGGTSMHSIEHGIDNLLISFFSFFGLAGIIASYVENKRRKRAGSTSEFYGSTEKMLFAGALLLFAARAVYYMQQHTN